MIIDDDTTDVNGQLLSIITNSTAASLFRVTGLTFQGGIGAVKYAVLTIGGGSHNIRIDHNHFNSSTYSPAESPSLLLTDNWTYGVEDHNVFDMGASTQGTWVWEDSYGGDSFGDGSWNDNTNFGTANFMFIEDNIFNGSLYANDCTRGGRYVFRYNILNGIETQTHPTGGSGRVRGCRAGETYQNVFNGNSACNGSSGYGNCVYNLLFLSSGTALVWGNDAPLLSATSGSGLEWLISLHNVRSDNNDYTQTATPDGWGFCGTNFDGIGSNWDQNTSTATGYACMDQPGRGKGDLLSGGFTSDGTGSNNVTNSTTGCTSSQACAWVQDDLEPVYEWLDTMSLIPDNPGGTVTVGEPTVLTQNQDYYLGCTSTAVNTGCTVFTGTAGVGVGSVAPTSATAYTGAPNCTAGPGGNTPGVGYWNTSNSTLYVCNPTNTWTAYYTPYTYPHPLTVPGPASGLNATAY